MVLFFMPGQSFALASEFMDTGFGVGYEDNLNHSGSAGTREGAAFSTAWIGGGTSKEVLKKHTLFFNIGYAGSYFQTYSDLTVHSATVKTGLIFDTGNSYLIRIYPEASKYFYGDSDRNADEVSLSLSLSSILSPEITVSAAYKHVSHNAKISVFSYTSDRLSLGGEFRFSGETFLSAAYSLEESESVFYVASASPKATMGKNAHSGTFGSGQLAVRDKTKTHIISFELEQEFANSPVYFLMGYDYSRNESDLGNFINNRIIGAMGAHF